MNTGVSAWALLAGIVDRPQRTLAEIVAAPRRRWLLPALIAVMAIVISAMITAPVVSEEVSQVTSEQLSQQLSQLPADQAAKIQAQVAMFQTPAFMIGAQIVSGILGLVIGWILQAGVLFITGLLAGADASFVRVLGASPWLGLPVALQSVVQAAYVGTRKLLVVNEGLSYLVSTGKAAEDARNLAYVLLTFVNPFQLWQLVLVYALFRSGMGLSTGTSMWLTIVFLAILVALRLGTGAVATMFSSGLG